MSKKRRKGAPKGNKNAVGHGAPKGNKNALGAGAPKKNMNRLEHGLYSKGLISAFAGFQSCPVSEDPETTLQDQIRILTIRERRLFNVLGELYSHINDEMILAEAIPEGFLKYRKIEEILLNEGTITKTEHYINPVLLCIRLERELTLMQDTLLHSVVVLDQIRRDKRRACHLQELKELQDLKAEKLDLSITLLDTMTLKLMNTLFE